MRIDARKNRARVLAAARAEFTTHGAGASLNRIAQRAGVGPGTLYRHFPSARALLVAVIADEVAVLLARGEALREHADPSAALREWLRAVAAHARAMRGLVAAELIAGPESAALAEHHNAIRDISARLLRRAGGEQPAHRDIDIDIDIEDVLIAVNAMAWASEQAGDDDRRLDRLLALITRGLP